MLCLMKRITDTGEMDPRALWTKTYLLTLSTQLLLMVIPGSSVRAVPLTYQLREEQISGTFVGNVRQDMMLRGELNASDGVNLQYTLAPSSGSQQRLFSINETSSSISTLQRIDRETVCPGQVECVIKLSVVVYRQTGTSLDLFQLWDVLINISDINDNVPQFPQSTVVLSLPESSPTGYSLHTSGAEDNDKGGTNSVQNYDIETSGVSDLFKLVVSQKPDGYTDLAIVLQQPLDREVREFYQLRILATDGGYPQRSGWLTVNITVADINDNRPTFLLETYNASVVENVPLATSILQVSAQDLDKGLNGRVTYSVSSREPQEIRAHLQIDENTGVISARAPIDYEERPQLRFVVEARDGGSPQLTGQTVVVLNVEDANDNVPQINVNLSPGASSLREDEPVNLFIAHVSVSDRDSGNNGVVICSMENDHFSLNKLYDHANNMYKVLLSFALDYETATSHRVTVTCRDQGVPALTNSTSFTVTVRDVNDNAPVFSQLTYTASVLENQQAPVSLLNVSARDYDTGTAGQVQYSLDNTPDIPTLFDLDRQTGQLTLRSALDREAREQYTFHVLAFDLGVPSLTSSAIVVITVLDENDNSPYFTSSTWECRIAEQQTMGTRVCEVTARDDDSPQPGSLRYAIVQNVGDFFYFTVNPDTGLITSNYIFDVELRTVYRLTVEVSDPQAPRHRSQANVTVLVVDRNDHRPVILYPRPGNDSLNVSYSLSDGSVITAVLATDPDGGDNGRLNFSMESSDGSGLFSISADQGIISLARTLRPQDVKEHVLRLRVQDGGVPPLWDNATLTVRVQAGNSSLAPQRDERQEQNLLIVVVIIVVTVVLALAVFITICLIRRIDIERKSRQAARKAEEEKMFHLKNQETYMMTLNAAAQPSAPPAEVSTSASSTGNSQQGRNAKRKEVSFTFEQGVDALNTSSGSINILSTFRNPQKDINVTKSGQPMKMTPLQMNIPFRDNQLRPVQEEQEYMEMVKRRSKADDALSESSGETGTSDSGRGGSEEDSHSQRGSALMETETPGVYHNNLFLRNPPVAPSSGTGAETLPVRGRHSFGGRNTSSGRTLRQNSPHVSFSGNLDYLGESSSDDLEPALPPPPDLIRESPPPPPLADKNFSTSRTNSYRSVLYSHPGSNGYAGVSTSLVKNSGRSLSPASHSLSPSPHCVQEGAGGHLRWGSPSLTNDDDDDRATSTTSGSYVISPEDLRSDFEDHQLHNDMIL